MPDTASPLAAAAPVSLFYSYAHEDEALRDALQRHLKILQVHGLIRPWHDRAIVPGQDWHQEINAHLQQADLILLLLSSYFFDSDYILGVELKTALQRAAAGDATVVPILLRPLDLDALDGGALPLGQMLKQQGLPRDLKPVTKWGQREEAWMNVSKGLRMAALAIQSRRRVPAAAPAAMDGFSLVGAGSGDALLDTVLAHGVDALQAAQAARHGPAPDPGLLRQLAGALISDPTPRRLLWVDDHPDWNLGERAALACMQIEVVLALTTDDALATLAADTEGFDLVISDWSRDAGLPEAWRQLLGGLRRNGHAMPFVVYHGAMGSAERAERAAQASAAGAFGDAVMPDQLLALVRRALLGA